MPDHVSGLPWTDEQWATLQRLVAESARKARVASSFLPLVGPLPPGQAWVPKQALSAQAPEGARIRGEADEVLRVDEGATRKLLTVAALVQLTTQQVEDPELASAKQMLSRAASVIGRVEDRVVFRGEAEAQGVEPPIYTVSPNDGEPGLLNVADQAEPEGNRNDPKTDIVKAVIQGITTLEGNGQYGPFACVLGNALYEKANTPVEKSLVLPSDRIVPFLDGGPLRRSRQIDDEQGVIVALAGSPVDLVVASDVHVRFLQVTLDPFYVLRVSERFALRIKQPSAVYVLRKP